MIGQNQLAGLKTCLNGTILFAMSRIFFCVYFITNCYSCLLKTINQYTPTVYNFYFLLCNLYMIILFDEKQSNLFFFVKDNSCFCKNVYFLSTEFKIFCFLFFLRAPVPLTLISLGMMSQCETQTNDQLEKLVVHEAISSSLLICSLD